MNPVEFIVVLCLTLVVATFATDFTQEDDSQLVGTGHDLTDPILTLRILEELTDKLRSEINANIVAEKRQFDGGYGSRYVAAHSVGSKLMALKQAADWNSPGRKRRDTITKV